MKTILIVLGIFFLTACGTRTGTGATGQVTIESQSFSTTGFLSLSSFVFHRVAPEVSSFKLCIEKIKLENESEELVEHEGSSEIEFTPGLIDVSSGTETTWGTVEIPVNFTLRRIKVDVHHDPDVCGGADFSVQFNEFGTEEEVELKWTFNPPVEVNTGDTLRLALAQLVSTLRDAAENTELTDETLKDFIESVEESAEESSGD